MDVTIQGFRRLRGVMTRTRARAPRSLVTLATVALALCTAGPLGFAVTQRDADGSARRVQVTGLAEVFTETWALEDRNGDSQADFIAARIVVPETPAPEELAAALSRGKERNMDDVMSELLSAF